VCCRGTRQARQLTGPATTARTPRLSRSGVVVQVSLEPIELDLIGARRCAESDWSVSYQVDEELARPVRNGA